MQHFVSYIIFIILKEAKWQHFDEVGISLQLKCVLLPSFIIFLVLTKPVNGAIF